MRHLRGAYDGKEYTIMPRSYEDGAAREWLVSNGLGGYASATAVGSNTRSYHGLLVAALKPPTNRWLLLSALDEEVSGVSLANHQYPGVIHPQGFLHLREFRIDPLPRFIYSLGTVRIEKTVFMVNGENTTIICYRISNGQGLMRIYPLVHSRSFHAASDLPQIRQEPQSRGTRLKSSCNLALISDKARYIPHETVYYNFEYEEERRRGLAWREICSVQAALSWSWQEMLTSPSSRPHGEAQCPMCTRRSRKRQLA